jgi:hypothetical protein
MLLLGIYRVVAGRNEPRRGRPATR